MHNSLNIFQRAGIAVAALALLLTISFLIAESPALTPTGNSRATDGAVDNDFSTVNEDRNSITVY